MILSSAAVGAVLEVDLEDPLEQPGPADARRPAVCATGLGGVERRRVGILVGTCRHHPRAQLRVGRQHPMESDQVQPRTRHQRRQALHELSGDITKCVVPSRQGGLEPEHHLPGAIALHALVGQRQARVSLMRDARAPTPTRSSPAAFR